MPKLTNGVQTSYQLLLGDNCEIMRSMTSEIVDLVVTSPPYGELRKYGGDSWDFYGVAWNLKRILKPGGVIVWVVADQTVKGSESGDSFKQALHFKELGLNLHDTMIWHKPNAMPLNDRRYEPSYEYMFIFSKGSPKTYNPIKIESLHRGKTSYGIQIQADGTRKQKNGNGKVYNTTKVIKNVWNYNVGIEKIKGGHPAIFPKQLAKDHILSWSNPGELVLDPFSGSGTTVRAAIELSRNSIGIEVCKEYHLLAESLINAQAN